MSKIRCSYDIVDIVEFVSISSILCWYRTYISIIRNIYYVDIDSISIRYRHVTVGSTVLLSISSISSITIRYRFVIVGSAAYCRYRRYRYDIISWLLDKLYLCRYRRYRYDIISWLLDKLYCCRYRRYRYDIVMYLLDQLYCCRYRRYRYDIVMFSSDQLFYCRYRRYRFDINMISFCGCRISCIAVDIDTISIRYRHVPVG